MNTKIYISIVLYNSKVQDLEKIMQSFSYVSCEFHLFIIDNSEKNSLEIFFEKYVNVEYIHNPSNPGFGAAHNLAIKKTISREGKYHFIVNPDVYFNSDVVGKMISFIEKYDNIGMMMPQILNLDGSIQYLPKLLPSPLALILRKLKKPNFIYQSFISKYELREVSHQQIYDAPILSGCFTLLNIDAIKLVGAYDDNFFMYFEDWDLSRRVNKYYRTVYFPLVSIYHGYESGANRNKKLLKIFVQSAIYYFNKWGWFFDKDRKLINDKTLNQFK